MREKFAASIATESDEREFGARIRILRKVMTEEFDSDVVDKSSALLGDGAAVAGGFKMLLNICRLG